MQEPNIIVHFELIHKLDIAFVGIGTTSNEDSITFRGNFILESEA